jgi:hypothetical protein
MVNKISMPEYKILLTDGLEESGQSILCASIQGLAISRANEIDPSKEERTKLTIVMDP